MKLREWLAREGLTLGEFGRRIDRSAPTVHRYCEGLTTPDQEAMKLIARETDGKVLPGDFFEIEA